MYNEIIFIYFILFFIRKHVLNFINQWHKFLISLKKNSEISNKENKIESIHVSIFHKDRNLFKKNNPLTYS